MKVFQFLAICSFFLFLLLTVTPKVHAATFSFSPIENKITPGERFPVLVSINTENESINAAQVTISYPADQVEFVGSNANESAFIVAAPVSISEGAITIGRGTIQPLSGTALPFISLVFKVKDSAKGSVGLAFLDTSTIIRDSDQKNILLSSKGVTYTITNASANSSPTPVSENASNSLQLTNISTQNVSYNTATITWVTNKPSSSFVEFGSTTKYGVNAQSSDATTNHSVALASSALLPGTLYHYRVRSTDADGNETFSKDYTFSTKGITLELFIKDQADNSIADAAVTLITQQGSQTATSDSTGKVTFKNVPPAEHTVITDIMGVSTTSKIAVKTPTAGEISTNTVKAQVDTVRVAGAHKDKNTIVLIGIVFGICLLLVGAFIFTHSKKKIHQ
jgi:hypothetical protein